MAHGQRTGARRNAAFYIASNCTYDKTLYDRFVAGENTSGDPSFTAYGCLVNHKAVCEGMSVAYQLLARATGLNSFCASDDNDKDHMFVYVQADGNWYKVDLASDRPYAPGIGKTLLYQYSQSGSGTDHENVFR